MEKKILYVTDLDGTLLRNDASVSRFTTEAIRMLTAQGLLFSYATARSYVTASKITAELPGNLPVIVYNGSFIVENGTGRKLLSNVFKKEETAEILDFLIGQNSYPIVNAFFDGTEKFSYIEEKETPGVKRFLFDHRNDERKNPITSVKELYTGEIFHITCIGEEEKLLPAYERFKESYPCVLYRDTYSGDLWLEFHPKGATKASAVLALKEMLCCDAVVCFGDGKNDIPMFHTADACYAVSNAEAELKAIATDVIGSNEGDGVAKWLLKHANPSAGKNSNIERTISQKYCKNWKDMV